MPDRFLMVDLETLDTQQSAAIVSIGAIVFDPRANGIQDEHHFSVTIDQKSNEAHGRTVSQDTLDWWSVQSQEAQDNTFNGPHTEFSTAIRFFCHWVNGLQPTCTRIWAKDPDFDVAILRHACQKLNLFFPFKFWEARSCRTAMEMAYPEGDFPQMAMDGPKHDSLADAKLQAMEIQHAYFVLGC
jgi:hypothetical protein